MSMVIAAVYQIRSCVRIPDWIVCAYRIRGPRVFGERTNLLTTKRELVAGSSLGLSQPVEYLIVNLFRFTNSHSMSNHGIPCAGCPKSTDRFNAIEF